MNGSTVKTLAEIGKFSDAEQIEGKGMARDQLLNYKCAAWVIFFFFIQCCSFGQYSGKVENFSNFSVKPCGYCSTLHTKVDSATRINAYFPVVDQMQGQ